MQDPSITFQPMKPAHLPEQEQLKCPRCDSANTKFCYYNNYNLSQPRYFCKNCRRYWTKGGALRNIPVGGGTRKNSKRPSSSKRSNLDPNTDPARLNRRPPEPSSSSTSTATATAMAISTSQLMVNEKSGFGDPTRLYGLEADQEQKILDMDGSFSSLIAANEQFGSIFEGLNPNGPGLKMVEMGGFGEDFNSCFDAGSGQNLGLDIKGSNSNYRDGSAGGGGGGGDGENYLQSGDWENSNGWPDLAIYTPGSSFR